MILSFAFMAVGAACAAIAERPRRIRYPRKKSGREFGYSPFHGYI